MAILARVLACVWVVALVLYWWTVSLRNPTLHLLSGIVISYLLLWGAVFWWSNVPKVETVQRFFLSSVSLALVISLLELLAVTRVVDFRLALNTPIKEPWKHPDNLLDAKLLHLHKPHSRARWKGIEYRYDRHGFRNEADFKAADIVVIGDSIIEGWNVSADDLLTARLAKQMHRSVANLGQSWYGPQQELEVLRRYGLSLRPKAVVWAFFEGNDLKDWYRYKEATKDWEKFSSQFHSFRQRSFTWNAVLAVQRLIQEVDPGKAARADALLQSNGGLFKESSGKTTPVYFWYDGVHLTEKDLMALEEMRSVFREADELCRANGARFLVVFVPNTFRVYKNFMQFDPKGKPLYWVINDLPKRLEAMVREESSDGSFLDLTPVLTEEASRGSLVYFADDTHWSPAGHRVAASTIADSLMHWNGQTRR